MRSINNFFLLRDSNRNVIGERGTFSIQDGIIKPPNGNYVVGQYLLIKGSILNDGIYQIERIGAGYIDIALRDSDYPAWIRPSGTVGLYSIGDRVTHNRNRYISLVGNNSWEPGTDARLWKLVDAAEHLTRDEVFTGAVYGLAVPQAFLELVDEIAEFQRRNPTASSAITSEAFGNYSYSKGTSPSGGAVTWEDTFSSKLNPYRRMFLDAEVR